MTFLVTDACVNCKFMDCTTVCPVNCFFEGRNMLVIRPDECIDCGSCEPICPSEAIIPDIDDEDGKWAELNKTYAATWPRLTERGTTPDDAEEWVDVENKLEKHFDPRPVEH